MFPKLDIEKAILDVTKKENKSHLNIPGGSTYKYDFEKGEFEIQDGRLVQIEGKEAIKTWIEKILRTEKFKFNIYKNKNKQEDEYGVTIKNLIIGKKLPYFFVKSEVKREIEEALKRHPDIEAIENFEIEQGKIAIIKFKVILKKENLDSVDMVIGYE